MKVLTFIDAYYIANWWRGDSQEAFRKLSDLEWHKETLTMYGKAVAVPRKVVWMGDPEISYRYSGVNHVAQGWDKFVYYVKNCVERTTLQQFNSVLGNYYANGEEYMGWHCDDEKELGSQPIIASVSFGSERRFCFRHKQSREKHEINLVTGSLLVMRGNCQRDWQHCLPKMRRITEPRINLTFRYIRQ